MKRDVRGRDLVLGNFWFLGYHPEIHDARYMYVGSFPFGTMWKLRPLASPTFPPLTWRLFFLLLLTLGGFHPSDDDDLTCFFLHPRRWRCCSPKASKLSTTRIGYCRGRDGIGVAVAFVCTMRKVWKYGTVPKSREVWGFNHFKFSMTWQKVSRRSAGRVGIRLITYM